MYKSEPVKIREMNDISSNICIKTTEMHTGGEAVRIIESGYPKIEGKTILEKRAFVQAHLDHLRKTVMLEPRGHYDMYGVLLVEPDHPEADAAGLFMHNAGYAVMCGHVVIALGRYIIDRGIVKHVTAPETKVTIQCPCGPVTAYVEYDAENKTTGKTRFHSVPSFVFALDVCVEVEGYGPVTMDIAFGGTFYALVPVGQLGFDIRNMSMTNLREAARSIEAATRAAVKLHHPDSPDLAYLYGIIFTDGKEEYSEEPTKNVCVFAKSEIDRSPCGSGSSARVAVQFARKQLRLGQARTFENPFTGSRFTAMPYKETTIGEYDAVVVEVSGKGYYTGNATFTAEADDPQFPGFLLG